MKISSLKHYLFTLGKKEYIRKNYTLDNIKLALKYLYNPEQRIKNVIHITGTNGKGTVAVYTSKILTALGYNVGLYTSPHIFDITERIKLNNENININLLHSYLLKIYDTLPRKLFLNLTYFELLTCIMFLYFADVQADYVVLEVGLGGKLDATNVIEKSLISCITSISFDHTEVLGKTKLEILKDKAGIVKHGSILICGEMETYLKNFLIQLCKKLNTKFVYVPSKNVKYKLDFDQWQTFCKLTFFGEKIDFVLQGVSVVQPYNLLLAITIVKNVIKEKKNLWVNFNNVMQAIKETIIPCRMQKFKLNGKDVIIDGAHNVAAVENFVSTVKRSNFKNFVICLTLMKEKNYPEIIKTLAQLKTKTEELILFKLPLPRAQEVSLLYKEARKYFDVKISKFETVDSLLKYLLKFSSSTKIFFIGSFYTAAFLPLKKYYE